MKQKIIIIAGVIALVICVLLAGFVDSEEKMYLESQPKADLKSRLIHH